MNLHDVEAGRLEPEEDERYFLTGRTEIAFALNDLIHRGELVTVSFNYGQDMILTTLLAVQREQAALVFDWGGSDAANRRLLASERSIFVAKPDGIKVRFACGAVAETSYGDHKAFVTALPDHVVRLQRRESYRVLTPVGRPLPCRISQADAGQPLQFPLHDLSVGGFAVSAARLPEGWEVSQVMPQVRIDLPEVGEVAVGAEIRHVTTLDTHSRAPSLRIGLRFLALPHVMEARIQRYIVALERARRSAQPD